MMKMPIRAKQHQSEDKSILEFQVILPDEWVYRVKDKDYGIDGEVEIFDPTGSATGKIFFVQLKSTEKGLNSKGKITYYLDNTKANYYSEIQLPVLFALYSKKEKQFYAKWVNNFINSISFKKEKDKSPIIFEKMNKIDSDFFSELHEKIDKDILNATSVVVSTDNNNISNRFEENLMNWIDFLWGDIVVSDNPDIEHIIEIIIKTEDNKILLEVKDSFFGTKSLEKIFYDEQSEFLWFPNISILHINSELNELFLWMSQALLVKYEDMHIKVLIELLKKIDEDCVSYENIAHFLLFLVERNESVHLQELLLSWVEQKRNNAIQMFTIVHLGADKKSWFDKLFVEMLLLMIKNATEPIEKGTYYYNIANATRSINTRQAIKYYMLAKKYKPDYLNRAYWFYELGGCFFVIGHYKISLGFYKKSLELNKDYFEDNSGYMLLFDTSFMARDFISAKKYLAIYEESLDELENVPSEIVLKATIIDWLESEEYDLGNTDYNRIKSSAIESKIEYGLLPNKQIEKELIKSLRLDPLCSLTHFNYGMQKLEKKDKMAYIHFLIAALHNWHDFESWAYTIMTAINSLDASELANGKDPLGTMRILPEIIDTYYTKYQSSALEELKKELDKQEQISVAQRSYIYDFVAKTIKLLDKHGVPR